MLQATELLFINFLCNLEKFNLRILFYKLLCIRKKRNPLLVRFSFISHVYKNFLFQLTDALPLKDIYIYIFERSPNDIGRITNHLYKVAMSSIHSFIKGRKTHKTPNGPWWIHMSRKVPNEYVQNKLACHDWVYFFKDNLISFCVVMILHHMAFYAFKRQKKSFRLVLLNLKANTSLSILKLDYKWIVNSQFVITGKEHVLKPTGPFCIW